MHRRDALLNGVSAVAACVLLTEPVQAADQVPLAVVAGKQSGIDGLSFLELKRLYLGDNLRGPGGQRLLALNRDAKSIERVGFDASVLGMTPEQAARYWIDRRIRGQSAAPKSIEPASVLQRVVAKLPGALGYVRHYEVSGDVRVVSVDGKRPGDAGYMIFCMEKDRARTTHGSAFVL